MDSLPAARETFRKGQRVKPSAHGIAQNIFRYPHIHGTVVGYARDNTGIRVARDGYKAINLYHASFWEPVDG